MTNKKETKSVQPFIRPPIVAILGHVDHGKTTLLDTIRKTNIAAGEAGGITQRIGAYQIELPKSQTSKPNDQKSELNKITFIDTPGHEAFAKMRSRGVTVADVAVLVVAATEGVKPQTVESIAHIKNAGIPYIVAMNKIDLPEANPDRVKQELAKHEVLVESYGGDVVIMPVSGKTGKGVPELLEAILLVAALKEENLYADPKAPLDAVVIESSVDKRRGILASIIVKNGTLSQGQVIYTEDAEGKVRTMTTDQGKMVMQALPSTPVEVMGWKKLPAVGSLILSTPFSKNVDVLNRFAPKDFSLPPLEQGKKLKLLLKTDTLGSLEVLKESMPENVEVVSCGSGEISDSDVLLAKSTQALIIGFNVKPNSSVAQLAQAEIVGIKTFTIIYELLDEIAEVANLLKNPAALEQELGIAKILAEFEIDDTRVAGCKIEDGRVARGDFVKLMRKKEEIGRTRIRSLRVGKNDVPKVEKDTECGVLLDKKLDFKLGDHIIAFKKHELLV